MLPGAMEDNKYEHLTDIVGGVILHWLNQSKSLLVARASTGNSKSHCRPIPGLSFNQTAKTGQRMEGYLT